jgi:4-aminobutyrate aminotransferase
VEREFMANAAKMGARLMTGLQQLAQRHAAIGEVRGKGLMIGIEFVKDKKTREPYPELVAKLERLAFSKGLLLLGAGKTSLRLAPPLVVDEYDVDTALAILDQCLSELSR